MTADTDLASTERYEDVLEGIVASTMRAVGSRDALLALELIGGSPGITADQLAVRLGVSEREQGRRLRSAAHESLARRKARTVQKDIRSSTGRLARSAAGRLSGVLQGAETSRDACLQMVGVLLPAQGSARAHTPQTAIRASYRAHDALVCVHEGR